MKTAPGPGSTDHPADTRRLAVWPEWAIIAALIAVYGVFFNPIVRFDGLQYIAPARSLVIDGNLNTYDEGAYFVKPGWNDVSKRVIHGRLPPIISYVSAPDYTPRGYRFVVFPIGNPVIWLPPLWLCHSVYSQLEFLHFLAAPDGFSFPYRLAMGWWSFLIGSTGLLVAYRILLNFYGPGISAASALFIFASGNLIQFITRDVTFSHSSDFLLINLSFLIFWRIINGQPEGRLDFREHFLLGIIIGAATIIRYQDIALLIMPGWIYLAQPGLRIRSRIRSLMVFIAGFLPIISLQLIYWKILYGSYLVSGRMMGTSDLASFNPLRPQLLEMLFGQFHGLFNWMPWLLIASAGFILFIRKQKRFGWIFLAIMLSQTYYIASRTEWWNLGFSVRRYSGWLLFFMLGTAELLVRLRTRPRKLLTGIIATAIVIWSWLFQIGFLSQSHPGSILRKLIGDASPWRIGSCIPIVPERHELVSAALHLKVWFSEFSWLVQLKQLIAHGHPGLAVMLAAANILFLFGLTVWIRVLIRDQRWFKHAWIFAAVCTPFLIAVIVRSDMRSETITVHRLGNDGKSETHQEVRIPPDDIFWGENVFRTLEEQAGSFMHPASEPSAIGFWLLGCDRREPLSVEIKVEYADGETNRRLFRIGAGGEDATQVKPLWAQAGPDVDWYVLRSDLSGYSKRPERWEITTADGAKCLLAGFWH